MLYVCLCLHTRTLKKGSLGLIHSSFLNYENLAMNNQDLFASKAPFLDIIIIMKTFIVKSFKVKQQQATRP